MSSDEELEARRLRSLYASMRSVENNIGGGEGIDGLYGSITSKGYEHLLDVWSRECMLDGESVVLDMGTGLGRPLLHAVVGRKVKGAFGIEVDPIKCIKARPFIRLVLKSMREKGVISDKIEDTPVPRVICQPVEETPTMDPATHAYSFWEGVPPSARRAFGSLFSSSKTLHTLAIVQRQSRGVVEYLEETGFGELELVTAFPVKMSGSGRQFQCYVLRKTGWERIARGAGARAAAPMPAENPIEMAGVLIEGGLAEDAAPTQPSDAAPAGAPAEREPSRRLSAAMRVTKSGRVVKDSRKVASMKDGGIIAGAVRAVRGLAEDLFA